MARTVLDYLRLGPTTLTGSGGVQTAGSVALATLVAGMSNNTQMFVDVAVAEFDNTSGGGGGGFVYASLYTLTAAILLTAGPTYTLGTPSTSVINEVGGGPTHASATLDISGGSLRLRINPNGSNDIDVYALVSTLSP